MLVSARPRSSALLAPRSLHVCRRAGIGPGDRVAVVAAGGGVGIHMVQMARVFGAEAAGLERDASKREFLEQELGITAIDSGDFGTARLPPGWDGRADVVVDFLGRPESLAWGLQSLAPGGRLVALTTFRGVSAPMAPRDLVFLELSVLGSRYAARAELVEAAGLVASGRIRAVVDRTVGAEALTSLLAELREGSLLGRGALVWS